MLLSKLSVNTARSGLVQRVVSQGAVGYSVRGYATTDSTAKKYPDPERFYQTVILTNGATFKLRTTSPRPQITLSKDTRSHPLWNPQIETTLDDDSGKISKFSKKFGELDDLADLDFFDLPEGTTSTTFSRLATHEETLIADKARRHGGNKKKK
ncbi:hypothetical protein K493DRAFT_314582 [Basidiobolus meristosporus CBS 931.73]|uniref:Large ribosomal subunit protein bL31c n=1 Tax=Basidiobolus meristosporus CBS 931.73 TaxID=1314790 RepID=A0A1Y1YE92_9FUNG|nr:hypothetical protein K493DRAFT_314582 [Basidiobolus meristosporus CBS 931.73]|eukprot:ORX96243.1 hypothetical protein K493DRAFT_314582 [Basidiobolus meristosporus CBS 931.73]